jgi:hypothetical protein
MRRKNYKVAAGLLFVAAAAFQTGPSYCDVLRSARAFQENFRSIERVRADLNPLEKVVFSLMLGDSGESTEERGAAPRRTS